MSDSTQNDYCGMHGEISTRVTQIEKQIGVLFGKIDKLIDAINAQQIMTTKHAEAFVALQREAQLDRKALQNAVETLNSRLDYLTRGRDDDKSRWADWLQITLFVGSIGVVGLLLVLIIQVARGVL